MNNAVQDLPDGEQHGMRNTGFPEPLSTERNTTLPHPDANTSPHASIEAADIPLARSASRLKFHRRHSKPRHTSSGSIPVVANLLVGPEHLQRNRREYEREKTESGNKLKKESSPSTSTESGRNTREGEKLSFERGSSAEGLSKGEGEGETGSQKKKRHFLRKLREN